MLRLNKIINKPINSFKRGFQSISENEQAKFENVNDWFDPGSDMGPLLAQNILRVQFMQSKLALAGKSVVDMGCGAGLFAESVSALCGTCTGVDMVSRSIEIAQKRQQIFKIDNLNQVNTNIIESKDILSNENELLNQVDNTDVVTSFEVIEHIGHLNLDKYFEIAYCLLKTDGDLFVSTINKTAESQIKSIAIAEHILNLVKPGTHEWELFVDHNHLIKLLDKKGFRLMDIQGVQQDPLQNKFDQTQNMRNNQILHAKKL